MTAIIAAGYPYELAGLVFYVFFLFLVRARGGRLYSQRTRVLTIAAAIGLVGVVPFHYAGVPPATGFIVLLGVAAVASAFFDRRAKA